MAILMDCYYFWGIVCLLPTIFSVIHATGGLTYTTDYSDSSGNYYLLDGQELTLVCLYNNDEKIITLFWEFNGTHIIEADFFAKKLPTNETVHTSRPVETSYLPGASNLTITLNKTTDEGSSFKCNIHSNKAFVISIVNILVPPKLVSMEELSIPTLQESPLNITCEVPSVYAGQIVTEFLVKVGDEYLPSSGTIMERKDELHGTFTVIYTQLGFIVTSSNQGQQVQCQVTWMGNTSVETSVASYQQTLEVLYPPEVTITIQPRIVMEGSELVLNCDINSNPRATILPWKFIGKYDKPENQTWSAKDTELRIENILYTDAGTYICTARNEYGQSDGQIRVDVHYSPRLYGDQQDLVFSSVLNSTVSLSLAVMVFPEFTDISAEFVWTRPGGQRLSENINISYTSIIPEVFQSTLQIDNVAEGDYGYYIAMVHSASFIITLEKTVTNSEEITTPTETTKTLNTNMLLAILVAGIVMLVLLIIIVIIFLKRHRHKESQKVIRESPKDDGSYVAVSKPLAQRSLPDKPTPVHGAIEHFESGKNSDGYEIIRLYENQEVASGRDITAIDRQGAATWREVDLSVSDIIHKGRYTTIQKGILTHGENSIPVAVKCNKDDIPVNEAEYLMKTISCFRKLEKHPNIVETFHVGNVSSMLVMKYYNAGNLRQCLVAKKIQAAETAKDVSPLHLALGAIRGLAFLSSTMPPILHYQLSADHVLVDEDQACRLTGFDFKDHVIQREMLEEEEGIYGAVEWKAPEVLSDCKAHSMYSDVWAFGILLYEIFTLGGMPYDGMTESDIKTYVRSAEILKIPVDCPQKIYSVMKSCWTYADTKRPDFQQLQQQIESIAELDNFKV